MVNEWTIYGNDGAAKAVVKELELHDEWMAECFITVTVKSAEPIDFAIGDYITYRDEKYSINYDPTIIKKARRESYGEGFVYDNIKFAHDAQNKVVTCDFTDIVLNDNNLHYTSLPTFPFFCESVDDLLDRIQACLEELYPGEFIIIGLNTTRNSERGRLVGRQAAFEAAYIEYVDPAGSPSTAAYGKQNVALTVDNITCWDAVTKIHEDFELNFIQRGHVIVAGTSGALTPKTFRYGKGKGLYELERICDSSQQIVTRLRAYGNETNIPNRYYANLNTQCFANVIKVEKGGTGYPYVHFDVDLNFSSSYFKNRSVSYPGTTECPNYIVQVTVNGITVKGRATKEIDKTKIHLYCEYTSTTPEDDEDEPDLTKMEAFIAAIGNGSTVYFASYINKDAWPSDHKNTASENLPNNMAVNRLMLPGFPNQSLYDWVKAHGGTDTNDETGLATINSFTGYFSKDKYRPYIDSLNRDDYGIRPASIYFDGSDDTTDIHPTIEEMTYGSSRIDVIAGADYIDDNGVYDTSDPKNFKITLPNLGFDLSDVYKDGASIDMKDGMCGARSFKFASRPKQNASGQWECMVQRAHDDSLDLWFPYKDFQLRAGIDHYVLIGIDMPDAYVNAAAEKLFNASIEALQKNDKPTYTYQPRIDEIWMQRQHDASVDNPHTSIHDTIKAGDLFVFEDEDLGIEGSIIIDVLTIKENGNNGLPTYEVTLRNEKQVSAIQKMIDKAATSSGGSGAGNGGYTGKQVQGAIENFGSDYYLSKIDNDAAQGEIGFLKGLWIAAKGLFGFDAQGNIKANNIEVSGDIDVDGSVKSDSIKSKNYTGDGITDTGWRITADDGTGSSALTVDNLHVRKKATFEELEVKKETAIAGNQIFSSAANIISRTDYYGEGNVLLGYSYLRVPWLLRGMAMVLGKRSTALRMFGHHKTVRTTITKEEADEKIQYVRCYFLAEDGDREVTNMWQGSADKGHDLARCQTMNLSNSSRKTYISDVFKSKSGNVFWWRKVVKVSSEPVNIDGVNYHFFDVSWADCAKGSDIPAAGDHVVQFGNDSNPDRMNLLVLEINGQDAPSVKALRGIYTYSLENSYWGGKPQKMKLSPATGYEFYGPDFKFIQEYGEKPASIDRGAWTDIEFEKDEMGHPNPQYSDDEETQRQAGKVRKCYYYDKVSHQGCYWLCVFTPQGKGVHYVCNTSFVAEGVSYSEGELIPEGVWESLSTINKAKCTVTRDYTIDEPSSLSSAWQKQVDRGTSVKRVTISYAKSDQGVTPPTGENVWKPTINELGLQNGDFLWTRTITEYSDTLNATIAYAVSRWGVDGDGIEYINSYYLGTSNTGLNINATNDNHDGANPYKLWMPGDDGYDTANVQHKWYDTFEAMVAACGGLGLMQDWNVWQKTIIHYDLPTGQSTRHDDVVSYQCNRIGMDGQIGQEEYYCLRSSDVIDTAFPNGGIDNCGIAWYGGSYAQSEYGRVDETAQAPIDLTIWSTSRPAFTEGSANKYLWNFEQRVDGKGTIYATKPICIGDASRGIAGVIELYACSAYAKPQTGRLFPNDIYDASEQHPYTDLNVWTDEIYDRAPSESLPYQWNWTRTLYTTPKNAADTARYTYNGVSYPYEDHYHVSAVRGTNGEDGAGEETIYTRNNTGETPATPTNPQDRTIDDYVPTGWTDNPQGIDYNNQYEFESKRKLGSPDSQGRKQWGDFSVPKLRSKWGRNGQDGDGTEYVFIRTKNNVAPTFAVNDGGNATDYKSQEWRPYVIGTGRTDIEVNDGTAEKPRCTDDPKGPDETWLYEWAAKRTMGSADAETGIRLWKSYYECMDNHTMAKWSNHAKSITKVSETYRYGVTTTAEHPTEAGTESEAAVLNKWYNDRSKVVGLWTQGRYLWTETTISWSDSSTTVLYTDERYPNDGIPGQDIIVDGATEMKYYVGSSNSSHPAEDSSDWKDLNQVTQTQGKWLWSKATTYYRKASSASGAHDAGYSVNYNVSYIAKDGPTGRAVSSVSEHYKVSNNSTTPPDTVPSSGEWVSEWSEDPNQSGWGASARYIWNYEKVTYTNSDGSTTIERTTPSVIAIWTKDGDSGRGIDSIVNKYKVTNSSTTPAREHEGGTGWEDNPTAPGQGEYLWNYEIITWVNPSSTTYTDVQMIGYAGTDGKNVGTITKYFQATTNNSAPSTPASTSTSGWTMNAAPSDWSESKKYLWCQEKTVLSDNSTTLWSTVYLHSVWGKQGSNGQNADYEETQYRNYDSRNTDNYGVPSGTGQGTWRTYIPASSVSYPYLWKRVRQHTFDSLNNETISDWSYGLMTIPGNTGRTGRFYYYADIYAEPASQYKMESTQAPYVKSGNDFWMLDFKGNEPDSLPASATDDPNSSSNCWTKMSSEQQYYIAKAFFGDYAQLGSFIINGDWMISKEGTYNGSFSESYNYFDPSYPNTSVYAYHTAPNGDSWWGHNFVPNFAVDGKSGATYQNDAHVKGELISVSGTFGSLKCEPVSGEKMVIESTERSSYTWYGLAVNTTINGTTGDLASFGARKYASSTSIGRIALLGVTSAGSMTYGFVAEPSGISIYNFNSNIQNTYPLVSIDAANKNISLRSAGTSNAKTIELDGSTGTITAADVKTPKIESGTSGTPIALPDSIITGSGTKFLPSSPQKGMVVFAKGTIENMTVVGNIMASDSRSVVSSVNIEASAHMFVYDGTRWLDFNCGN